MSAEDYPGQHKYWPNVAQQLGGSLTNKLPNYASMIAALELRVAALEKRLGSDEAAELRLTLESIRALLS